MRRSFLVACVGLGSLGLGATSLQAGGYFFADQVESYVPGNLITSSDNYSGYNNSAAALGKPVANTGTWFGTDYYLTPFNAAYSTSDLVAVGAGGTLTLRLPSPVAANGRNIGVHAGVALVDTAWPSGSSTTGELQTKERKAQVSVSPDGTTWASLGTVVFDAPTNFYSQGVSTPADQESPGTVEADWGKAFTGTPADFAGKDWSQILTLLDGSAGGEWLDLSGTGLTSVRYIKFDVPADQTQPLFVDAVVGVPEPSSLLAVTACGLLALRRRKAPLRRGAEN